MRTRVHDFQKSTKDSKEIEVQYVPSAANELTFVGKGPVKAQLAMYKFLRLTSFDKFAAGNFRGDNKLPDKSNVINDSDVHSRGRPWAVMAFLLRFKNCRLGASLTNSLGRVAMEQALHASSRSLGRLANSIGRSGPKTFPLKLRVSKLVIPAIWVGITPVRKLRSLRRSRSATIDPISVGIVPVRTLSEIDKSIKLTKLPMVVGMGPVS